MFLICLLSLPITYIYCELVLSLVDVGLPTHPTKSARKVRFVPLIYCELALSLVNVGLPTHPSRRGIFISCVGLKVDFKPNSTPQNRLVR